MKSMHGMIGMKKSRKTKLVLVREPNGRASRAEEPKEFAPTAVKRLRDAAMAGMADPEWGSVCGRMFLEGRLSAAQYAAAKWWCEKVARYHSAINAPPPDAKALVIGDGNRGADPDPESFEGQQRAKRDRTAMTDFLSAHCVLVAAGKLAESCVRSACERNDSPVGALEVEALKKGLLWLAEHRGLTKQVN